MELFAQVETDQWHIYRGANERNYKCDCPKQPCGLVAGSDYINNECPMHNFSKTLRGGHRAKDCKEGLS